MHYFLKFICEIKLYMFRTVPLSIIRSFSLYTQQWYVCWQLSRKLSANLYDIYHCCVYSEKTPDDGQRNCPKHVEFYSKNEFQKLVRLVGIVDEWMRTALRRFIVVFILDIRCVM